ncbi:MAG TPA: hypothetical protein G4O07_00530 [Dehalococcoidia bacterium]|nr:hypothetical protein [Dehalococcoidia bacterium]
MTEELGKIEKPDVERFKGERKLYVVPLLFTGKDSPQEYTERFELYWQQVSEQITNQEQKIGGVRHIYHESIGFGGEDGLKIMEQLSPPSYKIAKEKCEAGALMEAVELAELANECLDWERCLMLGFISHQAAEKISDLYRETSKKRYEYISQQIDETLGEDEVAILFIREGHPVQFPQDIEVFSVSPPALDNIHRWLRDRSSQQETIKEPEDDTESE